MSTRRRTPEQDRLSAALISLAFHGARPRCGDPAAHNLWLSDDSEDRATAATKCAGCPVLAQCGAAAESIGEQFGTWAGIDRTKAAS